jgi:hypothetical protein
MAESKTTANIRLEASRRGAKLFRNQVGAYKNPEGQYVSTGLCPGSSDVIGWVPVVVTPDMVGKKIAVFCAIEVKDPKKSTRKKNQKDFIAALLKDGGRAGFAHDVQQGLSVAFDEK